MGRALVMLGSLAAIGGLAFLTLSVAAQDGVTPLVVVSLVILAVLAFGVIGALGSPPDE